MDEVHTGGEGEETAWRPWLGRGRRRAESDDDAHTAPEAGTVPDLPGVPSGPVVHATDKQSLDAAVAELRRSGTLAFDTEFIGEQSYYAKTCLIQVATPEQVWLIDPLAGPFANPVFELVADPAVQTVAHAGAQDFAQVFAALGKPPSNVLDTQIAAGFADLTDPDGQPLPYPLSLKALVEVMLGVDLGKGLKFSQWDRRPLTEKQARYAADDVRYLPRVAELLTQRIDDAGNTHRLAQEMDLACQPAAYQADPGTKKIRKGRKGDLDAKGRLVLAELLRWRDRAAQQHDCPPNALVPEATLVELAIERPDSVLTMGAVRGMPKPVAQRWFREIDASTKTAMQRDRDAAVPPPDPRPTPQEREVVSKTVDALREVAANARIAHQLFFSRGDVSDALYRPNRTDLRLRQNWRAELAGPVLDEAVKQMKRARRKQPSRTQSN